MGLKGGCGQLQLDFLVSNRYDIATARAKAVETLEFAILRLFNRGAAMKCKLR
jgi:hypothetical protein